MHLGEDTGFSLEFLQIPGGAFDVQYRVWCARQGGRQVIAALEPGGSAPGPLRFLLIQRAIDALEHPAELWALNPKTGEAEPFEGAVEVDVLDTLLDGLAQVASKGPHPPLNALQRPDVCRRCPFSGQCYESENGSRQLSRRVLKVQVDA